MSIPMTMDERLADFEKDHSDYDFWSLMNLISEARSELANREERIYELLERLEKYEPKISEDGGVAEG